MVSKEDANNISKRPLVSVITVTRNVAEHIEETIKSVVNQTHGNTEFIIIDGGSTDGTVEVIKKYEDRISYWISNPDKGIYDAMNKGLAASGGEWIYFLGGNDTFYKKNTIQDIVPFLNSRYSIICGNIKYADGRTVRSGFSQKTLLHNTIHHQGAFYNRRLFNEWRYDDSLKLIADYELNLKIYLKRLGSLCVDTPIAICDPVGASRTQIAEAIAETNKVRGKFFHPIINGVLSAIYFLKCVIKNV